MFAQPLDTELLLESLDVLDKQQGKASVDLLTQSDTEPRFLSLRSSGCILSPANSNSQTRSRRKVSNARDYEC